jgi:hypothetical protein
VTQQTRHNGEPIVAEGLSRLSVRLSPSLLCALATVLAATTISQAANARLMTNGTNVRVRSAPEVTASILFELPLGAELLQIDRSNSEDPWFHVRTDDGREGWVLGRLTTSIDADRYDDTVEALVAAQLARHSEMTGTSFAARVQLFDLIERMSRKPNAREAHARFALYRLRSMRDVLLGVPFRGAGRDPYRVWIAEHNEAARYDEPGGTWMVDPAYVLKVHDEYRGTATADEIAWFYVQNGRYGECEGDVPCYVSWTNDLDGLYLRTYPHGRHSDDSNAQIAEVLNAVMDNLQAFPLVLAEFDPKTRCAELRLALDPLAEAVTASASPHTADALAAIDRFAKLCR